MKAAQVKPGQFRVRRPALGRGQTDTKPSRQALALFARSLAMLLRAGLPMTESVHFAAEAAGDTFAPLSDALITEIRAGNGLSESLDAVDTAAQPVFDPAYRALIAAGEATGTLDQTLDRLADYLERAEKLATAIRTALIYPAFLLGATVISLLVLLLFVIPRYEILFSGMGTELPFITRLVIGLGDVMQMAAWLVPLLILFGWLYWRQNRHKLEFRIRRDRALLALPFIGPLVQKMVLERCVRILAELVTSKVDLPSALALAADAAGNRIIASDLNDAAARLREGQPLSAALGSSERFPDLFIQLAKVGEESGKLDGMLTHLADIYALDVEAATRRLVTMIEPALILLIGLLMGFIVIAMISAVITVNDLTVL